jgi:poly(A) polymerase
MAPNEVRPQPLITGRDLIELGYRPGAQFKAMLHAAEEAQLEGTATTREQALALIQARFPLPSGEAPKEPSKENA